MPAAGPFGEVSSSDFSIRSMRLAARDSFLRACVAGSHSITSRVSTSCQMAVQFVGLDSKVGRHATKRRRTTSRTGSLRMAAASTNLFVFCFLIVILLESGLHDTFARQEQQLGNVVFVLAGEHRQAEVYDVLFVDWLSKGHSEDFAVHAVGERHPFISGSRRSRLPVLRGLIALQTGVWTFGYSLPQ